MTVKAIKEIRYSYNKVRKGILFLTFLWLLFGFVMIFYALFNSLQAGMQMSLNGEMDINFLFFQLAFVVLWLPFYSFFPIMLGIIQPDVKVNEAGLFIQVFFFWWVFVAWENVLEVRPRFRNSILRKEATVVLVQKLTPLHRLFGIFVRSSKPGFQINHSIGGRNELMDLIQRKMEQKGNGGGEESVR